MRKRILALILTLSLCLPYSMTKVIAKSVNVKSQMMVYKYVDGVKRKLQKCDYTYTNSGRLFRIKTTDYDPNTNKKVKYIVSDYDYKSGNLYTCTDYNKDLNQKHVHKYTYTDGLNTKIKTTNYTYNKKWIADPITQSDKYTYTDKKLTKIKYSDGSIQYYSYEDNKMTVDTYKNKVLISRDIYEKDILTEHHEYSHLNHTITVKKEVQVPYIIKKTPYIVKKTPYILVDEEKKYDFTDEDQMNNEILYDEEKSYDVKDEDEDGIDDTTEETIEYDTENIYDVIDEDSDGIDDDTELEIQYETQYENEDQEVRDDINEVTTYKYTYDKSNRVVNRKDYTTQNIIRDGEAIEPEEPQLSGEIDYTYEKLVPVFGYYILTEDAFVKGIPSKKARRIATIKKGTKIIVRDIHKNHKWAWVDYKKNVGGYIEIKDAAFDSKFNTYNATTATSSKYKRVNKAVKRAIQIANDDRYGYSMPRRGRKNNMGGKEYDCSYFVTYCFKYAGYKVKKGAVTYYMMHNKRYKVFRKSQFKYIKVKRSSEKQLLNKLKFGDILLEQGHTELYIGNGMVVGARAGNLDNKGGDSSGMEVSVCPFFQGRHSASGWIYIIRAKKQKPLWFLLFFSHIFTNYHKFQHNLT